MDRITRARVIAASNEEAAADRRRKARTAAPDYRRGLLLDAARLDSIAAGWRAEAVREEELAAERAVTLTPRRQCIYCDKRAKPGRLECNEHDDELPALAYAPSAPLTPGGVR